MKVLILGAGGIGGYFGARLVQAGADVTFAVRPRRAAQLAADGLVVRSPHGDFTLPPERLRWCDSAALQAGHHLVLFAPKAYDLDSAMDAVAPALGPQTILVPLLNGMLHIERLQARFGAARVAAGTCVIPATLTPEGAVVQLGPLHRISFGLLPGSADVKSSTVNGSEGWAILKNATNKDNAWAFLQYMASPAWQKKAAVINGDYPILASLYSDADLAKNVQDFATYGEQFKYMALRPQVPGYAQKSDIIQRHLSEALLQKATPADAMKAAADEVNKLTATP
jgi:2-dehydropantoate 2-reductase